MRLENVTHLTEDQGPTYAKMLDDSKTLDELKANLSTWSGLATDAIFTVANWKEKDFVDFRKCIAIERKGKFSGEKNAKRFFAVIMPEMMFRASALAIEYTVPWGLAVKRLQTV